jgi:hypothetical protein
MSDVKQDRIAQIIAVCVKNKVDPYSRNNFADIVFAACAQLFGIEKKACKPYLDVVITTWRTNRWKRYVETNPYLSKEVVEAWMIAH